VASFIEIATMPFAAGAGQPLSGIVHPLACPLSERYQNRLPHWSRNWSIGAGSSLHRPLVRDAVSNIMTSVGHPLHNAIL